MIKQKQLGRSEPAPPATAYQLTKSAISMLASLAHAKFMLCIMPHYCTLNPITAVYISGASENKEATTLKQQAVFHQVLYITVVFAYQVSSCSITMHLHCYKDTLKSLATQSRKPSPFSLSLPISLTLTLHSFSTLVMEGSLPPSHISCTCS